MVEITVPKWGLTMEEGKIVAWLKKIGEPVEKGEPLVEIETDKAVGEVESPESGILGEILAEVDTVVEVGKVIGRIYSQQEWARRQGS